MDPKVKILSLSEVEKTFDSWLLTQKEGAGIKRGILVDAMKPIVKDAKSNLQGSGNIITGNLFRALGTAVKVRRNTAYAISGARSSGKAKGNHFHFINSGTDIRANKNGASRGRVQGNEFFDRAVLSNMSKIPQTLQESFERRMKIFMDKKY